MVIKKEFYDLLEKQFTSSESFALDTNTLIGLVKESKFSILSRLTIAKNYVLTPTIASELIGLCHSEILEARQIQQIQSFVATCKRSGRLSRVNSKEIEKVLAPLVNLLPRKIVTDIVLGDHDSFVNGLIEKYNNLVSYMREKKSIEIDYSKISKEYASEKSKLLSKCITKFENQLFLNHIMLDDEKKERFEKETERLLGEIVKSVEGIISSEMKKSGGVLKILENIQLKLKYYSTKQYQGDIKAVSQAIANGATFSSFDSDVIFLMTLYSEIAA